jgi:hypothetical protein
MGRSTVLSHLPSKSVFPVCIQNIKEGVPYPKSNGDFFGYASCS